MTELKEIGNTASLSDEELEKILTDSGTQKLETIVEETKDEEEKKGLENIAEKEETAKDQQEDKLEKLADQKVKELEESINKLKKQIEDKERFIQARNREVGELRKLIASFYEKPKDHVDEYEFLQRPYEETKKTAIEVIRQFREAELKKQKLFNQFIPDLHELKKDIAQIALQEGEAQENVEAFLDNPYDSDINVVRYYAEKARSAKKLSEMQKQIEEMKKRLSEIPQDVLSRIQSAAKEKVITAKSAEKEISGLKDISEQQLASLSDAELEELLKRSQ